MPRRTPDLTRPAGRVLLTAALLAALAVIPAGSPTPLEVAHLTALDRAINAVLAQFRAFFGGAR